MGHSWSSPLVLALLILSAALVTHGLFLYASVRPESVAVVDEMPEPAPVAPPISGGVEPFLLRAEHFAALGTECLTQAATARASKVEDVLGAAPGCYPLVERMMLLNPDVCGRDPLLEDAVFGAMDRACMQRTLADDMTMDAAMALLRTDPARVAIWLLVGQAPDNWAAYLPSDYEANGDQ